jgi:hypothetical protein
MEITIDLKIQWTGRRWHVSFFPFERWGWSRDGWICGGTAWHLGPFFVVRLNRQSV